MPLHRLVEERLLSWSSFTLSGGIESLHDRYIA